MFHHSQDIAEYVADLLPIEAFFTFGTLCKLTRDVTRRANVRARMLRNNFPQAYILESIHLGMEDVFSSPHFSDKERFEQLFNSYKYIRYYEPPRYYLRRVAKDGNKSVIRFILENHLNKKSYLDELCCDAMKYAVLKDDTTMMDLLLTLSSECYDIREAAEEVKDLKSLYQNGYSELIENMCFELDISIMEFDDDFTHPDHIICDSGFYGSFGPKSAKEALIFAAENNIEPILRYLLKKQVHKYDRYDCAIEGFKRAAKNSHGNIVGLFMTEVFPNAVFPSTNENIFRAINEVFQRALEEEQSCILCTICNSQNLQNNQLNTILVLETCAEDGKQSLFHEMCHIGVFKNPVSVLKYAIEHENEFLIQKLIEFRAFG